MIKFAEFVNMSFSLCPPQVAPSKSEPGVGTCNLYFKAPAPPAPDNILYLNGTGSGLVNNCCFPSTVAPSYAPPGQVSSAAVA
jgi:hypothetical protein